MRGGAVRRSFGLSIAATIAAAGLTVARSSAQAPASTAFETPVDVQRVALVIGAENYEQLPQVPNANNDAYETANALRRAGFESIRLIRNPRVGAIEDFVDELAKAAGPPDDPAIIVFFFAGHGFQNAAFNYLVPVDARPGQELFSDSVPVINVLRALATHRAGLTIFLLDACRTTVTPETAVNLTTILPRGPVGFTTIAAPKNAIVGLATQFNTPARSAAHVGDANSPYTRALVKYIPYPAMSLDGALDQVRALVQQWTNDEQSPEVLKGGVGSAFYFAPTARERDVEGAAWRASLATNRRECVDRYVRTHPSSLFLKPALQWLDRPGGADTRITGEACPEQ
jgi:hypothetical protein